MLVLCYMSGLKIFLQLCGLTFNGLNRVFYIAKFLKLVKSNLSVVPFINHSLGIKCCQNSLTNLRY